MTIIELGSATKETLGNEPIGCPILDTNVKTVNFYRDPLDETQA